MGGVCERECICMYVMVVVVVCVGLCVCAHICVCVCMCMCVCVSCVFLPQTLHPSDSSFCFKTALKTYLLNNSF